MNCGWLLFCGHVLIILDNGSWWLVALQSTFTFSFHCDSDKHGWQFSMECRILSRAMFSQNFAEFSTGWWYGDKYGMFWSCSGGHRKLITICWHDCTMKYTAAAWALMGGILKMLRWAFLRYYQLFGRQTVSVSCGYWWQILHTGMWSGSGGRRKLITICGKFAVFSGTFWQTGPQNFEKKLQRKTVVPSDKEQELLHRPSVMFVIVYNQGSQFPRNLENPGIFSL